MIFIELILLLFFVMCIIMLIKDFGNPKEIPVHWWFDLDCKIIKKLFKKEMIKDFWVTKHSDYIKKKLFKVNYHKQNCTMMEFIMLFKELEPISIILKYSYLDDEYTLDITYDLDIGNETFKSKSIHEVKDIIISNFEKTGLLKERWVKNE